MPFLRWIRDQPYLLLTLTSLFWAGNAIVGRAVVGRIPPVALAELRWIAAFLIVLPFAWRDLSRDLPVIRRHFGLLTVLAFTGITAFNTLLYWSLERTTAINATLMQSVAPLLIGLFSFLLYRDALTRLQIAGIAVSLVGVAAIVSGGDPSRLLAMSLNAGDLVIVFALALYALYSALLRRRPGIAQLSFLAFTIGWGAVLLLPVFVAELASGVRFEPLDASMVGAFVYVSIFPSILAYLFFNRGVELIGANRAGPFFHLIPLFGVVLAVLFLGERPGMHHAVGIVLILCGVMIASRGRRGGKNRVVENKPAV
jgi:drug/metabolite transporter (DMT)-like permease